MKSLPAVLAEASRDIKKAGVQTLNTIGFDSQKNIVTQAEKDLDFKKNARRAMGFTVKKATSTRLEVQLFTKRGWLFYHLDEGRRKPGRGYRFNNRPYLLIPIERKAFTKKGRLRKRFERSLYIIPYGRDGLMFFRPKRGPSELIAVLKPDAAYHEDTDPGKVFTDKFKKDATRLFKFYLR